MSSDKLESKSWRIRLPADWEEGDSPVEGTIYFRSGDGTKGLYMSTLSFENDQRPVEAILTLIEKVEIESNNEMAGSHWNILETTRKQSAGVSCWKIDSYDEANDYRIQSTLLARLPIVVRATLHDYLCKDIAESSQLVDPIIASFELR